MRHVIRMMTAFCIVMVLAATPVVQTAYPESTGSGRMAGKPAGENMPAGPASMPVEPEHSHQAKGDSILLFEKTYHIFGTTLEPIEYHFWTSPTCELRNLDVQWETGPFPTGRFECGFRSVNRTEYYHYTITPLVILGMPQGDTVYNRTSCFDPGEQIVTWKPTNVYFGTIHLRAWEETGDYSPA